MEPEVSHGEAKVYTGVHAWGCAVDQGSQSLVRAGRRHAPLSRYRSDRFWAGRGGATNVKRWPSRL